MTGGEDYGKRQELTNARELALELLNRVDSDGSYLNLLLPKFQDRVAPQDKGFLQELTYGAIRWRKQYDLLIDDLVSNRPLDRSLRNILRLGAHQVFRMRVGAHAAVNETVELAKHTNPKTTGITNAVMRKLTSLNLDESVARLSNDLSVLERLSYRHSVPEWIIGQFAASLKCDLASKELERELAALNSNPLVSLCVVDIATREKLLSDGAYPGMHSRIALTAKGELSDFLKEPGVRVQDEGSQLIAQLGASLADGGIILDLCAGPGGKAALMAELAPKSKLICVEPIPARATLVSKALSGKDVEVITADGRTLSIDEPARVVVVDAPCSGLGSLRRKPESRWLKKDSDIAGLRALQLELLRNAARNLASGGYLLYSTCTPVLAETNSVVAEFLETHSKFSLEDATAAIKSLAPTLDLPPSRKTVQLWTGRDGTDDMFIALMRKD